MDRQAILSEVQRLEAQKARDPQLTAVLNEQISRLCDKLKQPAFSMRKVV